MNILRRRTAEKLESDLASFAKQAFRVLCPGRRLVWSLHYDYLCELLLQCKRRELTRLLVCVPPRSLKSILVTVTFPVWCWLTQPSLCFMAASFSKDLSTEHSGKRRALIASPWFQRLFGHCFRLTEDRADQFANDRRGEMLATSTGAATMGRGFDIGIVDDLMDPDQALSDAERKSALDWFDSTWRTRANGPDAVMICVQQRLHLADLVGHLDDSEPGIWTHVRIPLVAEESVRFTFPVSGRVWERQAGDVLLPQLFPPAKLAEFERLPYVFAGQFQQRPMPLEGNLLRYADLAYYGGKDPATGAADPQLPGRFDQVLTSVDCSFKDTSSSDFTAIATLGIKGPSRYVLEVTNEHLDIAGVEREILRHRQLYGSRVVLVEDKANGVAVVQRLGGVIPGILERNPLGGKVARLVAMLPEWQAHNWLLCRTASWLATVVQQLVNFPAAKHDDVVDSLSQAAAYIAETPQAFGLIEYLKQEYVRQTGSSVNPYTGTKIEIPPPQPLQPIAPVQKPDDGRLRCFFCGGSDVRAGGAGWQCRACDATWPVEPQEVVAVQ